MRSRSLSRSEYGPAAELRAALRRFDYSTAEVLKSHGLTLRSYELLLHVQVSIDEDRPATVTSLCQPLQTVQGNVTQLVDTAVKAGLLARTASRLDGRTHPLNLTPLGEAKLRAAHAELGQERQRLARAIGARH